MNDTEQDIIELPENLQHPHITQFEVDHENAGYSYTFKPFDGTEQRPRHPESLKEVDDPWLADIVRVLYNEMIEQWSHHKFFINTKKLFMSAYYALKDWTEAKNQMEAAYAAFDDLDDRKWKSARLRLYKAQDLVKQHAMCFDAHVTRIIEAKEKHHSEMRNYILGEDYMEYHASSIVDAAKFARTDISNWPIPFSDEQCPLGSHSVELIEEQNRMLDRVNK